MQNKYVFLFTFSLVLSACASSTPKTSTAERFDRFLDQTFEENLALSPEALTQFGRKDRYHELNDYTEAFAQKRLELAQSHLKALQAFKREELSPDARLSYDLWKKRLTENIEDFEWRHYRYLVTQHFGVHSSLPAFMMTKHRVDTEKDLQDYIARLRAFQRVFTEVSDRILASEKMGIAPPKFVYPDVFKASNNVITGEPFTKGKDSPLLDDFKKKLAKLKLAPEKEMAYIEQARATLQESVKPAYVALIATLKEMEARATQEDGAWKFPRGDQYYNVQLKRTTTTDLTADQIHELGLKNVERLRNEMIAIKNKLGHKGDLQSFFKKMRNDPKQYFPNTPAGREDYLKLAGSYAEFVRTKIPEYFRLIPKTPFEIRAVEKFREASAGKAFYDRPSEDGSRPGIYYVNLAEMKDVPEFESEALLYHEGVPGHHFQIALAMEMKNLPKFRRFGGYTAFSEGWGLYTERLAKEMSGYQDPHSELGRLSMEMLRAARLVVDTGIHSKKWTRAQALKYFGEVLPVSEGSQREQIDRYIVMPGQATAYMVGMLRILELREKAKAELGSRFDIRDFHDVVLGTGAVPLDSLEGLVNEYVAGKKL